MKDLVGLLLFFFLLATAMVGYTIHSSVIWSIVDLCLAPLVWGKWLVCHEVNLTVLKHTFEFLLQ